MRGEDRNKPDAPSEGRGGDWLQTQPPTPADPVAEMMQASWARHQDQQAAMNPTPPDLAAGSSQELSPSRLLGAIPAVTRYMTPVTPGRDPVSWIRVPGTSFKEDGLKAFANYPVDDWAPPEDPIGLQPRSSHRYLKRSEVYLPTYGQDPDKVYKEWLEGWETYRDQALAPLLIQTGGSAATLGLSTLLPGNKERNQELRALGSQYPGVVEEGELGGELANLALFTKLPAGMLFSAIQHRALPLAKRLFAPAAAGIVNRATSGTLPLVEGAAQAGGPGTGVATGSFLDALSSTYTHGGRFNPMAYMNRVASRRVVDRIPPNAWKRLMSTFDTAERFGMQVVERNGVPHILIPKGTPAWIEQTLLADLHIIKTATGISHPLFGVVRDALPAIAAGGAGFAGLTAAHLGVQLADPSATPEERRQLLEHGASEIPSSFFAGAALHTMFMALNAGGNAKPRPTLGRPAPGPGAPGQAASPGPSPEPPQGPSVVVPSINQRYFPLPRPVTPGARPAESIGALDALETLVRTTDSPNLAENIVRTTEALRLGQEFAIEQLKAQMIPPPAIPAAMEKPNQAVIARLRALTTIAPQENLDQVSALLGHDIRSLLYSPTLAPETEVPMWGLLHWATTLAKAGLPEGTALPPLDSPHNLLALQERLKAAAIAIQAAKPSAAVGPPDQVVSDLHDLPDEIVRAPQGRLDLPSLNGNATDPSSPGYLYNFQRYIDSRVSGHNDVPLGTLRAQNPEALRFIPEIAEALDSPSEGEIKPWHFLVTWRDGRMIAAVPDLEATGQTKFVDITKDLSGTMLPADAEFEWVDNLASPVPLALSSDQSRLEIAYERYSSTHYAHNRDLWAEEARTKAGIAPDLTRDPATLFKAAQRLLPGRTTPAEDMISHLDKLLHELSPPFYDEAVLVAGQTRDQTLALYSLMLEDHLYDRSTLLSARLMAQLALEGSPRDSPPPMRSHDVSFEYLAEMLDTGGELLGPRSTGRPQMDSIDVHVEYDPQLFAQGAKQLEALRLIYIKPGGSVLRSLGTRMRKNLEDLVAQGWLEVPISDGSTAYVHPQFDWSGRPEGPLDTRGRGQFFHGAQEPFQLQPGLESQNEHNIYGAGLYTTDDAHIGSTYAWRGSWASVGGRDVPSGVIYRIKENVPVTFYDLDAPMSNRVLDYLDEIAPHNQILDEAMEEVFLREVEGKPGTTSTLGQIMDEVRNLSRDNVPMWEVQEIFDSIIEHLKSQGYGGFTHKGGNLAGGGRRRHQVRIYWNPADTISFRYDVNPDEPRYAKSRGPEGPDDNLISLELARQLRSAPPSTREFINLVDQGIDPYTKLPHDVALKAADWLADNRPDVFQQLVDNAATDLLPLSLDTPTSIPEMPEPALRAHINSMANRLAAPPQGQEFEVASVLHDALVDLETRFPQAKHDYGTTWQALVDKTGKTLTALEKAPDTDEVTIARLVKQLEILNQLTDLAAVREKIPAGPHAGRSLISEPVDPMEALDAALGEYGLQRVAPTPQDNTPAGLLQHRIEKLEARRDRMLSDLEAAADTQPHEAPQVGQDYQPSAQEFWVKRAAELDRQITAMKKELKKLKRRGLYAVPPEFIPGQDASEADLQVMKKIFGDRWKGPQPKGPSDDDPQLARGEDGRVGAGTDPRLVKILGLKMYGGTIGEVIAKETVQDAVDAVRMSMAFEQANPSEQARMHQVAIEYDTIARKVIITDTGIGMDPETAITKALDPGGSGKAGIKEGMTPQELEGQFTTTGGFGAGKVAPYLAAEHIKIITNDGTTVTTIEGSNNQWLTRQMTVDTRPATPDDLRGTRKELTIENSDLVKLNQYHLETFVQRVMDYSDPIYPVSLEIDGRNISPSASATLGPGRSPVTTTIVDLKSQDPKLGPRGAWALDIYLPTGSANLRPRSYINLILLNNGYFQAIEELYLGQEMKVPAEIVVDVKSRVPELDPRYPFHPNREQLTKAAQKAVHAFIANDIGAAAVESERQTFKDMLTKGTERIDPDTLLINPTNAVSPALMKEIAADVDLQALTPSIKALWEYVGQAINATYVPSEQKVAKWFGLVAGADFDAGLVPGSWLTGAGTTSPDLLVLNLFLLAQRSHEIIEAVSPGGALHQATVDEILRVVKSLTHDNLDERITAALVTAGQPSAIDLLARRVAAAGVHEWTHLWKKGHDNAYAYALTSNSAILLLNARMDQMVDALKSALGAGGLYAKLLDYHKRIQAEVAGSPDLLGPISATARSGQPPGDQGAPNKNPRGRGQPSQLPGDGPSPTPGPGGPDGPEVGTGRPRGLRGLTRALRGRAAELALGSPRSTSPLRLRDRLRDRARDWQAHSPEAAQLALRLDTIEQIRLGKTFSQLKGGGVAAFASLSDAEKFELLKFRITSPAHYVASEKNLAYLNPANWGTANAYGSAAFSKAAGTPPPPFRPKYLGDWNPTPTQRADLQKAYDARRLSFFAGERGKALLLDFKDRLERAQSELAFTDGDLSLMRELQANPMDPDTLRAIQPYDIDAMRRDNPELWQTFIDQYNHVRNPVFESEADEGLRRQFLAIDEVLAQTLLAPTGANVPLPPSSRETRARWDLSREADWRRFVDDILHRHLTRLWPAVGPMRQAMTTKARKAMGSEGTGELFNNPFWILNKGDIGLKTQAIEIAEQIADIANAINNNIKTELDPFGILRETGPGLAMDTFLARALTGVLASRTTPGTRIGVFDETNPLIQETSWSLSPQIPSVPGPLRKRKTYQASEVISRLNKLYQGLIDQAIPAAIQEYAHEMADLELHMNALRHEMQTREQAEFKRRKITRPPRTRAEYPDLWATYDDMLLKARSDLYELSVARRRPPPEGVHGLPTTIKEAALPNRPTADAYGHYTYKELNTKIKSLMTAHRKLAKDIRTLKEKGPDSRAIIYEESRAQALAALEAQADPLIDAYYRKHPKMSHAFLSPHAAVRNQMPIDDFMLAHTLFTQGLLRIIHYTPMKLKVLRILGTEGYSKVQSDVAHDALLNLLGHKSPTSVRNKQYLLDHLISTGQFDKAKLALTMSERSLLNTALPAIYGFALAGQRISAYNTTEWIAHLPKLVRDPSFIYRQSLEALQTRSLKPLNRQFWGAVAKAPTFGTTHAARAVTDSLREWATHKGNRLFNTKRYIGEAARNFANEAMKAGIEYDASEAMEGRRRERQDPRAAAASAHTSWFFDRLLVGITERTNRAMVYLAHMSKNRRHKLPEEEARFWALVDTAHTQLDYRAFTQAAAAREGLGPMAFIFWRFGLGRLGDMVTHAHIGLEGESNAWRKRLGLEAPPKRGPHKLWTEVEDWKDIDNKEYALIERRGRGKAASYLQTLESPPEVAEALADRERWVAPRHGIDYEAEEGIKGRMNAYWILALGPSVLALWLTYELIDSLGEMVEDFALRPFGQQNADVLGLQPWEAANYFNMKNMGIYMNNLFGNATYVMSQAPWRLGAAAGMSEEWTMTRQEKKAYDKAAFTLGTAMLALRSPQTAWWMGHAAPHVYDAMWGDSGALPTPPPPPPPGGP